MLIAVKSQQTKTDRCKSTPPLTRFFGTKKNRVKGKLHYRRSILVLKSQNGEFENLETTFFLVFTCVK